MAFGPLALSPEAFWRLTPYEFGLLIDGATSRLRPYGARTTKPKALKGKELEARQAEHERLCRAILGNEGQKNGN